MAKRHLGQVFLYDPAILRKIIEVARLSRDDLVVEIGPGWGGLTRMLAERVKKVIAIELDERLFVALKTKLAEYKNVELILNNALRYPYENLPEFKVVANLPYYITTPIVFRLLKAKKNIVSLTLTIQKEVAKRMVAYPGVKDYGSLSIVIQYYAEPGLAFTVPKGAFRPVPKVDSAVVHLKILPRPPVDVKDETFFFRLVRTAFLQRRKILSNSLKSFGEGIKEKLLDAGIDPQRRAETLDIEEFARLSNILTDY